MPVAFVGESTDGPARKLFLGTMEEDDDEFYVPTVEQAVELHKKSKLGNDNSSELSKSVAQSDAHEKTFESQYTAFSPSGRRPKSAPSTSISSRTVEYLPAAAVNCLMTDSRGARKVLPLKTSSTLIGVDRPLSPTKKPRPKTAGETRATIPEVEKVAHELRVSFSNMPQSLANVPEDSTVEMNASSTRPSSGKKSNRSVNSTSSNGKSSRPRSAKSYVSATWSLGSLEGQDINQRIRPSSAVSRAQSLQSETLSALCDSLPESDAIMLKERINMSATYDPKTTGVRKEGQYFRGSHIWPNPYFTCKKIKKICERPDLEETARIMQEKKKQIENYQELSRIEIHKRMRELAMIKHAERKQDRMKSENRIGTLHLSKHTVDGSATLGSTIDLEEDRPTFAESTKGMLLESTISDSAYLSEEIPAQGDDGSLRAPPYEGEMGSKRMVSKRMHTYPYQHWQKDSNYYKTRSNDNEWNNLHRVPVERQAGVIRPYMDARAAKMIHSRVEADKETDNLVEGWRAMNREISLGRMYRQKMKRIDLEQRSGLYKTKTRSTLEESREFQPRTTLESLGSMPDFNHSTSGPISEQHHRQCRVRGEYANLLVKKADDSMYLTSVPDPWPGQDPVVSFAQPPRFKPPPTQNSLDDPEYHNEEMAKIQIIQKKKEEEAKVSASGLKENFLRSLKRQESSRRVVDSDASDSEESEYAEDLVEKAVQAHGLAAEPKRRAPQRVRRYKDPKKQQEHDVRMETNRLLKAMEGNTQTAA